MCIYLKAYVHIDIRMYIYFVCIYIYIYIDNTKCIHLVSIYHMSWVLFFVLTDFPSNSSIRPEGSDSPCSSSSDKVLAAMGEGWPSGRTGGCNLRPFRFPVISSVQEISNRTHVSRTPKKTWVSNSSIATYLPLVRFHSFLMDSEPFFSFRCKLGVALFKIET